MLMKNRPLTCPHGVIGRCEQCCATFESDQMAEHPDANNPSARILHEIFTERERQVVDEGYDEVHDDQHAAGSIAAAAGVYAIFTTFTDADRRCGDYCEPIHPAVRGFIQRTWPWDVRAFKPKGRRRDLIRAAALLVAEIERLDRAAVPTEAAIGGVDG
jgi:hypothetical protein